MEELSNAAGKIQSLKQENKHFKTRISYLEDENKILRIKVEGNVANATTNGSVGIILRLSSLMPGCKRPRDGCDTYTKKFSMIKYDFFSPVL